MDLNQVIIAQSHPENQFGFNTDQFDEAVLRAEERRALWKRGWSRCCAFLSEIGKTLALSSKMVTSRWIA